MGLLLALHKRVDHVSHAGAYWLWDGAARGREVLDRHARDLRRQLQGCNVSHLFVRSHSRSGTRTRQRGAAGADGEGEDAHQALRDVLGELLHVAPDLVDRARAADVLRDALPVPLVQLQAFQEPRVLLLRPRLLRGPGARLAAA